MFFGSEDDDQDFLSPGGSSKLGSLFGQDQSMSKGGNESLTYTAPKEPKKQKAGDAPESASSVLYACAVHAYKYTDGAYASQGKMSCAVLGSHASKDVQQNNYASFYDDARQNWSINFETEQQLFNLAKQVCLCKHHHGDARDHVTSQDYAPGEGGALESGDSAEVKYTGWLLQNNAFGDVFDTNENAEKLFRFKLGKGKVIKGWEEGIVGMKKTGKRLIVVPPRLGYSDKGSGSKVPPGATLIFQVEVVRVKLSKDKDSPASGRTSPAQAANEAANEDDSVKARSKSISEQLQQSSSNTSDKAKLISRMAKMGQQMLPMTGAVPAQPDSDEEPTTPSPDKEEKASIAASPTDVKPQKPAKPAASPAAAAAAHPAQTSTPQSAASQPASGYPAAAPAAYPFPQDLPQPMMAQPGVQPMMAPPMMASGPHPSVFQGVPAASQLAVYQSPQQFQQQFQPPVYQAPAAAPSTNSESSLPVLLTESRSHNTEVRLAITKVQDKLDSVSQKIDHAFGGGLGLNPTMEAGVLMHNIQRIIQENERMKKEIFEKSAKNEALNEKIAELLSRNQQYVEQSHVLLEQRSDALKTTAASSQAKVLTLEQEKVQLATELSATTAKLTTLQLEVTNMNKREAELQKQFDLATSSGTQNKHEITELKSQNTDLENQVSELSASLKTERHGRKSGESKIVALEEEVAELKSTNSNLEKAVADRKKRAQHEKEQLENELEELKAHNEKEVTELKDRIRRMKTSSDTAAAEQVSHIEKELENTWQEKLDRMLASANDRHQRAMADVQEEKAALEAKVRDLQEKFAEFRNSRGDSEREKMVLQEELEEMKIWKTKYENLRIQATTMKDRYEERIQEVEGEKNSVDKKREELVERVGQLQIAVQKAELQARTAAAAGGGEGSPAANPPSVSAEVKKIMNSVYQQMRLEFEPQESYQGSDIHGVILSTVKDVTLKMLNTKKEEVQKEEEEEESEAEDEEEDASLEPTKEPEGQKSAAQDNASKSTPQDNASKLTPQDNTPKSTPQDNTPKSTQQDNTPKSTPQDHTSTPPTPLQDSASQETSEQKVVKAEKSELTNIPPEELAASKSDVVTEKKEEVASAEEEQKENVESAKQKESEAEAAETGEAKTDSSADVSKTDSTPVPLDVESKQDAPENLSDPAVSDEGKDPLNASAVSDGEVEETVEGTVAAMSEGPPRKVKRLSEPEEVVEEAIVASSSTPAGDRGNTRYSKELDKLAQEKDKKASPEKNRELDIDAVEALIIPETSTPAGDKGNPAKTKELDKLEKRKEVVEEVIKPSRSEALGDTGNPAVTKELDRKDEEQDEDEAPVVAVSDELATAKTEKKDENVSEAQPALNVEENTEHEEANGTPEQTPDEVEATRERDKNSTEAEDLDEEETDPFADADDNDEFFKPAQPVDAEEEEADDDEEEQKEEAWEEVHAELQETEDAAAAIVKSVANTDEETHVKTLLFSSQMSDPSEKKEEKSEKKATKRAADSDDDFKDKPPPLFADDDDDDDLDWLS